MSRQWTALLIAPDQAFAGAPRLRGEISLEPGHGPVVRADLHASALGVFEAFVAGERVGDDVLSPGWSAYEWRIRYRSYDVTEQLRRHLNADGASAAPLVVGLLLGNGWYRGRLGFFGSRAVYGDELAGIAELEIEFADGHVQTAGTDITWRAASSHVLADDLYDGQTIDARLADDTWLRPDAALTGWTGVHQLTGYHGRFTEYLSPPVRRQEVVAPQRIRTSPAGRTLVDFGQNLVGWIRLHARGPAGTTVTVRYAEVLEDGELCTRALRTAQATDRFVLSGADDVFESTFTFHGFRYAELDGYPGELRAEDLSAVVVHSDLTPTGTFACSDPLLNRLHANVVWSLRGNVLDVPTDCPQRDERLGWTGDLSVFAPTAAFLYDVSGFLDDWLADLACEQQATDGRVPLVIPDNIKYDPWPDTLPPHESTAIWGDAAVWVPWALWQAYGDVEALGRHYPAMTAHVRRVRSLLSPNGLWDKGNQLGDWLDPTAPADHPERSQADPGVVATACLVRTLAMTAGSARVLGRDGDAGEFDSLHHRVRRAFTQHYVRDDGTIISDCPTVYTLAIVFDLLDPAARERAGQRLAELVQHNGFRIATGFAGTPFILDALSATGHLDVAYRLLTERECPSWLYPVTMGATTIWERWDSMLPDGTVNDSRMTSFNHYALGAVADWMHRTIGGIAPAAPGYARVLVAPQPGGDITWARTSLDTRYGTIAVAWQRDDTGHLIVDVDVPAGIIALIRLPGLPDTETGAGSHRLTARQA